MEIVLILLAGALAAIAVTMSLWHQCLSWAQDSLLPWLKDRNPTLAALAKEAFIALDRVVVSVHQVVRQAWTRLRRSLLKEVILFRKESANSWLKVVTAWLIEALEKGEPVPVKVETTERLSYYDLPPEIREASLRWDTNQKTVDLTELRDKEIAEMAMSD